MSLLSREAIRRIQTKAINTPEILSRYYRSIDTAAQQIGSITQQQQPQFPPQRQQRRTFSEEGQALRKQSPAAKKKAKAASDGPSEEATANNKTYKMVVDALDAPITKPPPASEEEMARRAKIGRNHVIGRFESHNAFQHDLACKIRMKNHAMKMLPKHSLIRNAALEIDSEGPPKWRHIPVWTPPIPGFDPDEFLNEESKTD